MSDEELIARLRNYGHVGTVLEAADRIEALVKYRDVYAEMERIATDALRKSEARAERLEAALRLIEVIYYREDRELNWIAAHMRGCATAALKGEPLELYRRLAGGFPARAALKGEDHE